MGDRDHVQQSERIRALRSLISDLESPMMDAQMHAITARLVVDGSLTGNSVAKRDENGTHRCILSDDEWNSIIWIVGECAYNVERLRKEVYGVIEAAARLK